MIRYCSLIGLLAACLSGGMEAAEGRQEIVIVHFGDSTCITSYLPTGQRVEAVLNARLSAFCLGDMGGFSKTWCHMRMEHQDAHDHHATLIDQIEWLRNAGYFEILRSFAPR